VVKDELSFSDSMEEIIFIFITFKIGLQHSSIE
jgi:hypothetical protein